MSSVVVRKIVLRPPAMRMKNDDGMRSVAPLNPAIAASVNSSAWENGNFRLIIWTVMIPQYSHTAKPHSRQGIDIHRLRVAIRLPSASQKAPSSGSQVARFLAISLRSRV